MIEPVAELQRFVGLGNEGAHLPRLVKEAHMTKFRAGLLAVALCSGLSLGACQNTKMQQENQQLKTQVADLQKQLGEMGNRVDEATTAKNELTKENAELKAENDRLKARHGGTKKAKSKRRHHRAKASANPAPE
jgi:septal ring factor EnvC (AmiA/AmiB activator)